MMYPENHSFEKVTQARQALVAWYAKKGLKEPELTEKVSRVMKNQFPGLDEKVSVSK